jgi:hypothetical protein
VEMAKKEKIFGQTVIDFVNAKIAKETRAIYFNNMIKIMGFSSASINRWKEDLEKRSDRDLSQ